MLVAQTADTTNSRRDTVPQSYNWTPRAPISAEEAQRRADKRAELEEMRNRFRRFHQEEEQVKVRQQEEIENGDYLWDAAEGGAELPTSAPIEDPTADAQATEALRIEIGRNLQVKGPSPSSPTSTSARSLEMYEATDIPANPPQGTLELDIKGALQERTPTGSWENELQEQKHTSIAIPNNETAAIRAGAIIPVRVDFVPTQTTLAANHPQPELEHWAQRLRTNPSWQIEIRTHAHVHMRRAEAQSWSTARAQTIADFLLANGVMPYQLQLRGYGNLSPLTYENSEQGQLTNERVEFIVLQQ